MKSTREVADELAAILKRISTASPTLGHAKRAALTAHGELPPEDGFVHVMSLDDYRSMIRNALTVCLAVDTGNWTPEAEDCKVRVYREASDLGVSTARDAALEAGADPTLVAMAETAAETLA